MLKLAVCVACWIARKAFTRRSRTNTMPRCGLCIQSPGLGVTLARSPSLKQKPLANPHRIPGPCLAPSCDVSDQPRCLSSLSATRVGLMELIIAVLHRSRCNRKGVNRRAGGASSSSLRHGTRSVQGKELAMRHDKYLPTGNSTEACTSRSPSHSQLYLFIFIWLVQFVSSYTSHSFGYISLVQPNTLTP
jgi:hypothetical protein